MEALNYFTVESDEDGMSLMCSQCGWWITVAGSLGDMVEYALSHTYRRHAS